MTQKRQRPTDPTELMGSIRTEKNKAMEASDGTPAQRPEGSVDLALPLHKFALCEFTLLGAAKMKTLKSHF